MYDHNLHLSCLYIYRWFRSHFEFTCPREMLLVRHVPRDGNCLFSSDSATGQPQHPSWWHRSEEATCRVLPESSVHTWWLLPLQKLCISTCSQWRPQQCRHWSSKWIRQHHQLRWWSSTASAIKMAAVPWEIKCRCLGDQIAVQGLADMFHVDIHIISTITINLDMELITTSHHIPVGIIHIWLIHQFHYQVLERINEHYPASHQVSANNQSEPPSKEHDKEFIEDQEAFKYQAQLRGLP